MKESKFIELLNLYVDKQISPEEAASLEETILQNPRRRKIYSQYCRMHRACAMALEQHKIRVEADQASGRVVAFEAPRRPQWGYYVTGLAAAACVVLVAGLTISRFGGKTPAPVVAAAQAPTASVNSTPAAAAVVPVRLDTRGLNAMPKTDGYVAQRLRLVTPAAGVSFLAVSDLDNARISLPKLAAPALSPIARPSIEDFVFGHDPAVPENPRIFRPRQPGDGQEENALEFQRQ